MNETKGVVRVARKGPQSIEAVQYDGTNAAQIAAWIKTIPAVPTREVREVQVVNPDGRRGKPVIEFDGRSMCLQAHESPLVEVYKTASVGEWIVYDDGFKVLYEDWFETLYEPASETALA